MNTNPRIERLWYLEQQAPKFARQLWVRAETETEAIEYTVKWGVPRDEIVHMSKWGFNLDDPGIVLSIWSKHHVET